MKFICFMPEVIAGQTAIGLSARPLHSLLSWPLRAYREGCPWEILLPEIILVVIPEVVALEVFILFIEESESLS